MQTWIVLDDEDERTKAGVTPENIAMVGTFVHPETFQPMMMYRVIGNPTVYLSPLDIKANISKGD